MAIVDSSGPIDETGARARGDTRYSVVVGGALSHNYCVLRRSSHLFPHERISRSYL